MIKVDGSGRLTLRNRRYLRKLFQDVGLYGSNTQKKVNQTTQAAESDTPPAVERLLAEPIPTTHQPLPTHWPLTTQPPPMLLQESARRPFPTIMNEQDTSDVPSSGPIPLGHRPHRTVSPRLVYDAAKGKYVPIDSGSSIDD